MPFHSYPFSQETGFVTAQDVPRPLGGHIVLYDLEKGAFPKLAVDVKKAGRWIVVYRPGSNYARFKSRSMARQAMTEITELKDKYGLLPKIPEASPPPAKKILGRARDAAGGDNWVMVPKGTSTEDLVALARGEKKLAEPATEPKKEEQAAPEREKPEEKKEAPRPAPTGLGFHKQFGELMQSTFTPERIVERIEDMLNATRTVVTKTNAFEVPDYQTRERAIRLAIEFTEGKPKERPDVKEEKKITWEQLQVMVLQSPAARRALRTMLDDAELPTEEVKKA